MSKVFISTKGCFAMLEMFIHIKGVIKTNPNKCPYNAHRQGDILAFANHL